VYAWSRGVESNPYDNDPFLLELSFNLNLTEIPEGNRSIVIYATEAGFYGTMWREGFLIDGSSSVNFTIDTITEPFPATFIVAMASSSVAVVSVGLIVYFKKRKH
jgi:hypothetical protein